MIDVSKITISTEEIENSLKLIPDFINNYSGISTMNKEDLKKVIHTINVLNCMASKILLDEK